MLTKTCPGCEKDKPLGDYSSHTSRGTQSECKLCCSDRAKRYNSRSEIKQKSRNKHLKATYGITLSQFDEVFLKQLGKCKVCRVKFASESDGHIDHDHSTGRVRGILCRSCNLSIGFANDNASRLRALAKYLDNYESSNNYVMIQSGMV